MPCLPTTTWQTTTDHLTVPPSTADRSTSSSPLSSETSMDPAIAAELALAVQLERLRVTEALAARDNVVVLLEDAYVSVRRKTATISRLERELEILRRSSSSPSGSNRRPLIQESQCGDSFAAAEDQTDVEKGLSVESHVRSDSPFSWVRIATPSKITGFLKRRAACTSRASDKVFPVVTDDLNEEIGLSSLSLEGGAEKTITERHSILASLALPPDIPGDELQLAPPHSYSLGEFLGNTTGVHAVFDALISLTLHINHQTDELLHLDSSYDVLMPDREEHGYFLTPVFKCTTNPRAVTAHRWSAVDVLGHMREPTDGKWYYAGTYVAFRMDDLTTQEWGLLSTETTQALIKETLAGRKNVSPQNTYETGQLYAAGALRASCVGLQCIGFNNKVYHSVLEQSRFVHWTRSSGWTSPTPPTGGHDGSSDDGKSSVN
ncbi:hypothetical protein EDC04DRAFT_2902622 [Pisolithus marmoratus]|nr:hypothetical protein EDC04DRAFT_2902622 [Pisolithus marmoratus]